MTDFAPRLRSALAEKGLTMRGVARALNYDPAYLSRVLNGKQQPSEQLIAALDRLLEAEGELIKLITPDEPETGPDADIIRMRSAIASFLAHDNRYGGDAVAHAAVQIWQEGQRALDKYEVPKSVEREYISTVSEVAEIAGWLLFDAGERDASRSAFLEAHVLARQAGDASMQWFALDMLAMNATEYGRPGETLRIVQELADMRVPPRVALLAQIRTARALAITGSRQGAMDNLAAAKAGLSNSISLQDPSWTWWVDERELAGHEGECLLSLGDASAAIPKIQRALEFSQDNATNRRVRLYYTVALLATYTAAQAWRECEDTLTTIPALLESISSGRCRHRLRGTLRDIARTPNAPVWLSGLARDIASLPELAA